MTTKRSGRIIDGKWVSDYDQGHNSYNNGVGFRKNASHSWQAGWRAALHNDIKLSNQLCKPSLVRKIQKRVCERLGIPPLAEGQKLGTGLQAVTC